MAPLIILIRHAQALHNIDDDWELHDPGLTKKGIEQCQVLATELERKFPFAADECRIVVSPLTRTLQTVHYALPWLRDQGVPVEVRAEWQESTNNPCDIGTGPTSIKKDWPDFDFSQLDPIYPQKVGLYGASEEALLKRASIARRWLSGRPEKCIVVVTHSGFLKRVVKGARFRNVEYRTYEAVDNNLTGDIELKELAEEQPLERG
ncbi:histidine phosphatase superfamily [Biscogniauxia marginata]|nr:histidine phosphatase superfamily [Biscogniauxia marginata]